MVQQSQQQQELSKGPAQQQAAAKAAGLPGCLYLSTTAAGHVVLQATTTLMTASCHETTAHCAQSNWQQKHASSSRFCSFAMEAKALVGSELSCSGKLMQHMQYHRRWEQQEFQQLL
jgi:hypothetical protein